MRDILGVTPISTHEKEQGMIKCGYDYDTHKETLHQLALKMAMDVKIFGKLDENFEVIKDCKD